MLRRPGPAYPRGVTVSIRALRPDDIDIMLAVDPDYQQRGIGLALVSFAVDRITELGIPLAEIGTGGDPGHARPAALRESRVHARPACPLFQGAAIARTPTPPPPAAGITLCE